jgi:N4-bis(aminopropyl)spermidine synthase
VSADETPGPQAVAAYLDSRGPDARRTQRLLAELLRSRPLDVGALVERTGAPRRDGQHLLRLMGQDEPGERYRELARLPEPDPGPWGEEARPEPGAVQRMRDLLADVPPPLTDLDHVQATAETALRRALLLHGRYDLSRTRLLLLGDHDCTSLALGVLGLRVRELAVVDVDQRLLAFLRRRSEELGTGARHLFCDLRLGLPPSLRAGADVVLTDPPYSPEGLGLFAARALQALPGGERGHLLIAYGHPPDSPALGLKAQAAMARLELTHEAILPAFNRYEGAHAIGARASLYLLQPTRRSTRIAERQVARFASAIYSRGRQSVESAPSVPAALLRALEEEGPDLLVGEAWERAGALPLATLLYGDAPGPVRRAVVALAPFHGRCLVQAALAVHAEEVDVLVPNDTEGLRSAGEQEELRSVLETLYEEIRLLRSYDGTALTLVRLRGRRDALTRPFEPLADGVRPLDLPSDVLRSLAA